MGIYRHFPYSNFHEMNMDELIKIFLDMQEEWNATKAQWASYKDYIDNYFNTLDLSEETYDVIMRMIDTGMFNEVVDPTIIDATSAWLAEHITQPVGVVIDNSLTVSGACADAKVTGDKIKNLTAYKVNQPLNENNQPINGTEGQILRTKGDGSTEWSNVGLPTDEQTAQAVSDWLDEHPEATTTVQDGSLTEEKFSPLLKLKTINYFVTPQMFGAKADGVTDDTIAFQQAINSADCIFVPSGTYLISQPLVIESTNLFYNENGYEGKTIIGAEDAKLMATDNIDLLVIRGTHHKIDTLILTFDPTLFGTWNKALLKIESLNVNSAKQSCNNYFNNIRCVSLYNVATVLDHRFYGVGIQIVSDGTNATYQNKFSNCNVADLYKGIEIINNSTAGINGNYFHVDLWNCCYLVMANGGGNIFEGNNQAPHVISDETNYCFYITGNFNTFIGFVYDVGESIESTTQAPYAYVTGINNSFESQIARVDTIEPWYAVNYNNFKMMKSATYGDDQIAHNIRVANYGIGTNMMSMAPYVNSLLNSGIALTMESTNVTPDYIPAGYTSLDANGMPTNIKNLAQKSSNGRQFEFVLNEGNNIKITAAMPSYSAMDSIYLYFSNRRPRPTKCEIRIASSIENLETDYEMRQYDFSRASATQLMCLSLPIPYFVLHNNCVVRLELEFADSVGSHIGFSYISAVAINEISGPLLDV